MRGDAAAQGPSGADDAAPDGTGGTVWVGILGPLEVAVGGRPVRVGGPRVQAVLAALLVARDRVVSVEDLGDTVWGDDPPASVRNQVLMAVSVLRRSLRTAGRAQPVIQTSGPGYRVDGTAVEVDAWTAEDRIAAGREAAARGDAPAAARLLRQALDLWRGPALSGLDAGVALSAAARRWDELRLAVTEEWTDLELGLGRHRELVSELTAHLTEAPLREGLRGQLMVALYRSGRRADALEVFAAGRGLLAEELGIDPGPALRRLHEAILSDDPELSPAAAPGSDGHDRPDGHNGHHGQGDPPAPAVAAELPHPAELPPAPPYVVGREADLRAAVGTITTTPRAVVVIDGPGGIGKSALALQAAHQVAEYFPDGQLYVDLHGFTPGGRPVPPVEVVARFLRSLGLRDADIPPGLDEAANRFRSLTTGRRVLILLDNAVDAAQVRPLLPSSPASAVIVTSRRVLGTLDSASHLHLTSLDHRSSLAVLGRALGAERVAAEPAAARRIVEQCGGLPLALRISAARLITDPGKPLAAVAESLADARRRLDGLAHADLAVRTSFETSFTQLRHDPGGADAARLFTLLGLLDVPSVSTAVAAAVTDWSEHRVEAGTDVLVSARLLERQGVGHVRLHDLLRLFARELAESELGAADRATAQRRVAHHVLATALRVQKLLNLDFPYSDGDLEPEDRGVALASSAEAVAWLDAELDTIVAVVTQFAGTRELYEVALRIGRALIRAFLGRGRIGELAVVQGRLHQAAAEFGDVAGQGETLNFLGVAALERGQFESAQEYLEASLALRRRLPDRAAEAVTRTNLAILYGWTGRLAEAADIHADLARTFGDLGDARREALSWNNLAQCCRDLGRLPDAVAAAERGLAVRREIGAHHEIGMTLLGLGQTHLELDDPRLALKHLEEAHGILSECGDLLGQSSCHWGMGQAHQALGDTERARAQWREAVTILHGLELIGAEETRAILASDTPDPPSALQHVRRR